MKYQNFFLPFQDLGKATEELNSFLTGRRIATVDKAFVQNGDNMETIAADHFVSGIGQV